MASKSGRRSTNVTTNRRLHDRPIVRSHVSYYPDLRPSWRGGPLIRVQRPPPDPTYDRRFWHPYGDLGPRTYSGTIASAKRLYDAPRAIPARIVRGVSHAIAPKRVSAKPSVLYGMVTNLDRQTRAIRAFSNPLSVPLCHARRIRREVLHALKVTGGRGANKVRRPKYNENSGISCRA